MATRFYFGQLITTPALAFSATWSAAGSTPQRARMRTVKHQAALSTAPFVNTSSETTASILNKLNAQFIARLGAAQTITGTIKGYALFSESDTAQDCRVQCEIRVISEDGTVRGTLLASDAGALSSEFVTTATNRRIPLLAATNTLTSVSAQAGDYLVVEIGHRTHVAGATSYNVTLRWHDDPATGDLPEDETSTDTTLAPWIEFSQNLVLNDKLDDLQADPAGSTSTPETAAGPIDNAPSTQSADALLEFATPSISYDLANRVADQSTNLLGDTFLSPLTVGDLTSTAFVDSPVQQFISGATALPAAAAGFTDNAPSDRSADSLLEFSTPAISYTLVDPTNRDIAATLPLIPVPIIVAPAVVNLLPSDGTITVGEVVSFDVFDAAGLVACVVLAKLPEITRYEVVYDGAVFGYQYEGSTVTPITNALHFECVRVDGWPVGVTFKTIAVNTGALVG